MKIKFKFLILICLSSMTFSRCVAQINNAKTENIKIYGNCEMCKVTIEKAAYKKQTTIIEWDKNTKVAKITYDTTKTTLDEILKKISDSGYDSDKFRAPNKVYNKLHGCCQYDRPNK